MHKNQSIHLLHADDDQEDRWIFKEAALEADSRLNLTQFEDGTHLIHYLRKNLEKENAVLAIVCDMQMPLMDGLQVLDIIRKEFSHHNIPILILSTSSLNRDIDSCMELGAAAFHSKPSTYKEYLQVVSMIIANCKTHVNEHFAPARSIDL
jgi:CheY-like chemotaxis protein